MKKSILLFIVFLPVFCAGQVPSSCNVSSQLYFEYERDIKNLVLNRMHQLQSADTANVQIATAWQDTIAQGLAAIFNATSVPERDSVFNIYCVHDNNDQFAIVNGILLRVDTNFAWTQAWQNFIPFTGNPFIDALMANYNIQVAQFFNWSIGSYALLHTDSIVNIYALIDSFMMDPAILSGEPDAIFGNAGHITYDKIGNDRFYNFFFEFADCFDGCDNYREWQFKVNNDCSVDYLGYSDWGIFGIMPLPAPLNCNIFVSVNEQQPSFNFKLYPNPTRNNLTFYNGNESLDKIDLNIYDYTGRMITQIKNISGNETAIDLTNFNSGLYIYSVLVNGRIISNGKIIKE